jgi:glycosyltransferase involved in cell wall biosynthesis
VLHEPGLGGATLAVLRCLPGLAARGWEFSFWVPPGETFDALKGRGERVAGVSRPHAYSVAAFRLAPGARARLGAMPAYRRAFRDRIAAERPLLVHANSHVTLADAMIARRARVPTLIHIHETFGAGVKWALARRAVRRYGTEVVAVSDACAEALAVGGWRPRVIRNGVELPPAQSAGSPGGAFVVGSVAGIARRKGIDVLVEAARLVRAGGNPVEFELIGAKTDPLDAEWAEGILARAREAGIRHTPRADVAEALDRWDAFVLASRRDPFPLSMLEAMASGLPVIGSAVDGIPEQLAPGTGLLVKPEDPAALAEAILSLAAMAPEARRAMGEAGRERMAREFTIERQVDALDAAYRAAIADG